jgi:hypothetical protein
MIEKGKFIAWVSWLLVTDVATHFERYMKDRREGREYVPHSRSALHVFDDFEGRRGK